MTENLFSYTKMLLWYSFLRFSV